MSLRLMVLLCAIACIASAQIQPHFGVVAGVPLTDTLTSSESGSPASTSAYFDRFNSKTKRLLIGPAFRLDLPRGLGLEFDALWQRVNSDETTQSSFASSFASFATYSFAQTSANRWQFPLLIQYAHALPMTKTKMFVEFGPSLSHIGGGQTTFHQIATEPSSPAATSTTSSVSSFTGQGETQAGITAGAGIDVAMFHLHLRPQFRYSHWFSTTATPQAGFLLPASGFVSNTIAPSLINPVAVNLSVTLPLGTQSDRTQPNEVAFLLDIVF